MSELTERLDEALRTVIPGDPPVDEAIRRGKTIRVRRRVTAMASVAAVALFAGLGYPALTHPLESTPGEKQPSVTDVPPGPGAPAGLIASGTINGQGWQVFTDNPARNGAPGQQCFRASGPAFWHSAAPLTRCLALPAPQDSSPASLLGFAAGRAQATIGQVGAGVSYVLVKLADGTDLKLIPVIIDGIRYVAFATPLTIAVDSATAYLANGQYLTAIPFNASGVRWTFFGAWLAPGESGLPRITKRIASGSTRGRAWSVTDYSGPWGLCLDETPIVNLECMAVTSPPGTSAMRSAGMSPGVVWGPADLGVSYVVVTLADGATLRAPAVQAGEESFFAVVLRAGQTPRRWAAYDAAGNTVCSGSF